MGALVHRGPELPDTSGYPKGYLDVELCRPALRKSLRHPGGGWRDAIHGVYVYAADDGTPLAHIRTLGMLIPKKLRRYALRVEGVTFVRIVPLISTSRPIRSDVAGYDTAKAAMQAGSALINRLRNQADT